MPQSQEALKPKQQQCRKSFPVIRDKRWDQARKILFVMDKPLTCDHYRDDLAYIGVLMSTPLKKQIPCNGS